MAREQWVDSGVKPHDMRSVSFADMRNGSLPVGRCEILANGANTRRSLDVIKCEQNLLGMTFIQQYDLSIPAGSGTLTSPVRQNGRK